MKKLLILFYCIFITILLNSQVVQDKIIEILPDQNCNFISHSKLINDSEKDINSFSFITSSNDIVKIEDTNHNDMKYKIVKKDNYYVVTVSLENKIKKNQEYEYYIYSKNSNFIKPFENGYKFYYYSKPSIKTSFNVKIIFPKESVITNIIPTPNKIYFDGNKLIVEYFQNLTEKDSTQFIIDFELYFFLIIKQCLV